MCFLFLVERTETVADVKTLLKTLGNLSEAGRCILNHENAGRFSPTLQEMENLPSIYLHQYFLHNLAHINYIISWITWTMSYTRIKFDDKNLKSSLRASDIRWAPVSADPVGTDR